MGSQKKRRARGTKRTDGSNDDGCVVILDDIPIPNVHPGRDFRFPFDRLEIGQCFIVKGMDRNVLGSYKRYAERKLRRHFVTKRHEGGVGVWRVT